MEAARSRGFLGSRWTVIIAVLSLSLGLALLYQATDLAFSSRPQPRTLGLSTAARIEYHERRIAADPRDFVSLNSLAQAYIQRARETADVADYDRAETALARSLKVLPEPNYAALALTGVVLNAKHRFVEAAEYATQAVALKPNNAMGYAILGDAAFALGRYEEASGAYRTAAELDPSLPTYGRLAHLQEVTGDLERAEELWWRSHEEAAGPSSEATAWVHVQLGDFYFGKGELAKSSFPTTYTA